MGAAYHYYRLELGILQSTMPGRRWVLENSPHLLFLDALHEVLPDAIFVQLHRDPLEVLASNCRLAAILRGLQSDAIDPHELGASMLELLGDYVDRLMAFRAKRRTRPWIDVRFARFVRHPLDAVAQRTPLRTPYPRSRQEYGLAQIRSFMDLLPWRHRDPG